MPWTAIFAVVALLGLQLAIAAASLYAYNRIRGKEDLAGQQREAWSAELKLAVTNADSARRQVETIEVTHYKSLAALFQQQSLELAEIRSKFKQMEMELATCRAKLASEERMERRRLAKQKDPEAEEDGSGAPSLADLAGQGIAVPLSPQTPAPQAPRSSSFGRPAR